jgi:hypothetical protein
MSPFEFVFTLFGLILGLALAEVLGSFAKAVKLIRHPHSSQPTRLGLLTPLLATFVMLDIVGFWFIAWRAREAIPPTPSSLLFALLITGLYYFAASWIFSNDSEGADLDAHFFENKRDVLLVVFICNLLAHAARLIVIGPADLRFDLPGVVAVMSLYFIALLVAAFSRRRWIVVSALVVLILLYANDAIRSAIWVASAN